MDGQRCYSTFCIQRRDAACRTELDGKSAVWTHRTGSNKAQVKVKQVALLSQRCRAMLRVCQ